MEMSEQRRMLINVFIITISSMYTMTSNLSLGPPWQSTSLTSAVRGHFRYAPDMATLASLLKLWRSGWSQVTISIQPI